MTRSRFFTGVLPAIARATEIALADARVIEALPRRGIKSDRVTFLGGLAEGVPLVRRGAVIPVNVSAFAWDPVGEASNVSGLVVSVDLAAGTVIGISDSGGPYSGPEVRPASLGGLPLKPLNITQPEGPSFRLG